MKRNNWLMIAYIIFIFVSCIIRCFYIFPMWESLVIAVTVSTSVFSYADVFLSRSESIESQIKITRKIDQEIQEQIQIEKPIADNILKEALSCDQERPESEKLIKLANKLKSRSSDLEKMIREKSEYLEKKTKQCRTYNIIGAILSVIGFVLFLCILVYEPIKNIFIKHQDLLTVTSFALVLSTQFIRDFYTQMVTRENESKEEALSKLKKYVKRLKEAEESYLREKEDNSQAE